MTTELAIHFVCLKCYPLARFINDQMAVGVVDEMGHGIPAATEVIIHKVCMATPEVQDICNRDCIHCLDYEYEDYDPSICETCDAEMREIARVPLN
jgi:hypothetical protein